jgi:uncharacterized membrane protein YraQ (UPF0718 family)
MENINMKTIKLMTLTLAMSVSLNSFASTANTEDKSTSRFQKILSYVTPSSMKSIETAELHDEIVESPAGSQIPSDNDIEITDETKDSKRTSKIRALFTLKNAIIASGTTIAVLVAASGVTGFCYGYFKNESLYEVLDDALDDALQPGFFNPGPTQIRFLEHYKKSPLTGLYNLGFMLGTKAAW